MSNKLKFVGRFFKFGDMFIYAVLLAVFFVLYSNIKNLKDVKPSKVEIYVNSTLKYVYPLQKEQKMIFVDTDIGGVNIEFKDYMVRCATSYSPRQIAVKQGFIKNPGELIIGIPDRLLIKIVGESEDDIDYILK